jgi:hypothetical protein
LPMTDSAAISPPRSPMAAEILKDASRAISIAGLCLMTSWIELHFIAGGSRYYLPAAQQRNGHIAAVLLTGLVGGLLLIAMRVARHVGPRTQALVYLSGLTFGGAISANALRIYASPVNVLSLLPRFRIVAGIVLVVVGAALFVLVRHWRLTSRVAQAALLCMAPFPIWMCTRSAIEVVPSGITAVDRPEPASRAKDGKSARVVWIIFDEFDYGVAFARRPPRLALAEFDRFRQGSLFATNASPAGRSTDLAISSIIIGHRLLTLAPETDSSFSATPADGGQSLASNKVDNVFRRTRSHGHDTWVVGWALPYCRTWRADLSGCDWEPAFTSALGRQRTITGNMLDQLSALSPFNRRRLAVHAYRRLTAIAERLLREEHQGLVFLHLPVPHPPPIYDRRTGQLTQFATARVEGYLANLALADRTLGVLRSVMERSGTWDTTTVLVTADHPWRQSRLLDNQADRRVPFMLKLPGQHEGFEYGAQLDTARTGSLLLAILDKDLTRPDEVARWLDADTATIVQTAQVGPVAGAASTK